MAALKIRAVTIADWPNIETLFGGKGACGGCWCMWWRVPRGGKLWEESKGEPNRQKLHDLVRTGRLHAVMAFHKDQPVGWCTFGPRDTFPRIRTVRALQRETCPGTWSIVCFYVASKWRNSGVARRLLEAATKMALSLGASEVEAFPVVPKKPPAPVPPTFAWTGVPRMFEASGYVQIERAAELRPIYVKRPD